MQQLQSEKRGPYVTLRHREISLAHLGALQVRVNSTKKRID